MLHRHARQVSVPKGKKRAPMDQSDVVKAAEDITKVIKDGKQDDASVKSVLSESKTHGGIGQMLALSDAECNFRGCSVNADISRTSARQGFGLRLTIQGAS